MKKQSAMSRFFVVRSCVAGLAGLVLAATFASCSGSGGGSSVCLSAGATICAKACSCGDGGMCDLVVLAMPDAADMGQTTFNFSASHCTTQYQSICGSHSVADVDSNACQAGLAAAACAPISTTDPSSGQGLVLPAACAPLFL
jgi:hypothetical protein